MRNGFLGGSRTRSKKSYEAVTGQVDMFGRLCCAVSDDVYCKWTIEAVERMAVEKSELAPNSLKVALKVKKRKASLQTSW